MWRSGFQAVLGLVVCAGIAVQSVNGALAGELLVTDRSVVLRLQGGDWLSRFAPTAASRRMIHYAMRCEPGGLFWLSIERAPAAQERQDGPGRAPLGRPSDGGDLFIGLNEVFRRSGLLLDLLGGSRGGADDVIDAMGYDHAVMLFGPAAAEFPQDSRRLRLRRGSSAGFDRLRLACQPVNVPRWEQLDGRAVAEMIDRPLFISGGTSADYLFLMRPDGSFVERIQSGNRAGRETLGRYEIEADGCLRHWYEWHPARNCFVFERRPEGLWMMGIQPNHRWEEGGVEILPAWPSQP